MLIYRIENSAGVGPFHEGNYGFISEHWPYNPNASWEEPYHPAHVAPSLDGLGYPEPDDRYGCCTKEQVRHWFRTRAVARQLWNRGFRIVRYEVPAERVKAGRYQVVFKHYDALPLRSK